MLDLGGAGCQGDAHTERADFRRMERSVLRAAEDPVRVSRAVVAFLGVAAFGCGTSPPPTRNAGGVAHDSTATVLARLTSRVWARADAIGPPGVMRVFLPNGTLVIDSCWETYRL